MPKQSKPKFKIIKKNENPFKTIIESSVTDKVWVTRFTIDEIQDQIAKLAKVKTELESRKKVEEAKIQNIKNHHPEYDLNMDEKYQIAIALNQRAKEIIREADSKIEEINAFLKQYAEDIQEVTKQTGLKLPEEKI